ncbi:MAG: hypothetical protein U0T82_09175 [Bacteroidales bacterium]
MSLENARLVIEGPCRVHGIGLAEGFAEKVLAKLCPDENEVELTFLQVFLDRLYRMASKDKVDAGSLQFHTGLIEEAGSVTDILGNFLDEQIAQQENPELALAALKAFVSSRGTRQPMDATEVRDYALSLGKMADEKELTTLLAQFVNLRILHDKDQHGKYELRHDALAAKIFEKFTLVEKELLEVRRFVENAQQNFQSRGIFLGNDDLNYLDGYGKRLVLPPALEDFVQMNRQKLFARQKAFRRLSWISAIIFLVMVGGVVQYIIRTQRNVDVQNLVYKGFFQSQHSVKTGLATICDAWEKDSSSIVLHQIFVKNIYKLLYESTDSSLEMIQLRQEYAPVDLGDSIVHAEIGRDGKIIFGWLADQTIFIYKPFGKKLVRFSPGFEVIAIEVAGDRDRIAVISREGPGKVFDFEGNVLYDFLVSPNYLMNERLACFFPHGMKYDLALVRGNNAIITDSLGKQLFVLEGHHGNINSLDVSPDGRFVATASCDKLALIWNFNQLTKVFSPYDTLAGHKDTVWSVEFDSQGLFLLTASSDTTTRIWDLNGNDRNSGLYFGSLVGKKQHLKTNNILSDNDKYDPHLSIYYRKSCNAGFTLNGYGFITCFYEDVYASGVKKYYEAMFDVVGVNWLQLVKDPVLDDLDPLKYDFNGSPFSGIAFSDNNRLAALVPLGSDDLVLSSLSGYKAITLKGTSPMFSAGSKDLFWTRGSELHVLPLRPPDIARFINDSLGESSRGIWISF